MQKHRWMKTIAYGCVICICFAALLRATYKSRCLEKPQKEYAIVTMGDSVMGVCRDETSIVSQLSSLLNTSVFNGALGGTSLSRINDLDSMGYSKDCMSGVSLSKAIASGDFGPQQATKVKESMTEYFPETIDEMEQIDFSKVDILLLQYGFNDYHAGIPIYPAEGENEEASFVGALESCVKSLQEAYPNLRIVLVTPTYSWYPYNELTHLTCEEYNLGGGVLEEYVNAEIQTAHALRVEILDVYHNFYSHDTWEDWEIYTTDGLHPNEEGRTLLAEKIAAYLQEEH